jgi:nitrate reductase NapAB chaperone NapD
VTVSGIVVACRPEDLAEMTRAVNAFPWAEVHYTDPNGRLVVTVEADDVEESMDRLKDLQGLPRVLDLQGLPRVLMAELAEFAIEDEDA